MSINWRPMKENLRLTHTVKCCAAFKNNENLHLLTLSSESRASQSKAQTLQPDYVSSEYSSGPYGLCDVGRLPTALPQFPVYKVGVTIVSSVPLWEGMSEECTSTESNVCNTESATNSMLKKKIHDMKNLSAPLTAWKKNTEHYVWPPITEKCMWTYTECRSLFTLIYSVIEIIPRQWNCALFLLSSSIFYIITGIKKGKQMITPNWYFWTLGTSTSLCFLGGKLAKCNTLSGPVVLLSGIYPIKITYTYIHIYKCTHVHKGIFIQVIFITAKKKNKGTT